VRVAYVVSDLSYPPTEGLHQQTLILIQNLRKYGIDVELHGFVKSLSQVDQAAMQLDTEIQFASPPIEQPGSLLRAALGILMPFSKNRREFFLRVNPQDFDILHFEGISASALTNKSSALRSVVSFVDPGSRRNYRFFRLASGARERVAYLVAAFLFFVLERWLRRGGPTWHVVSPDDRWYLEHLHKYPRVISIPVSLPPELDRVAKNAIDQQERSDLRIRVLVYGDLRQKHMRDGLKAFAEEVFQRDPDRAKIHFIILGRIAVDSEMAGWFQGLNYEFVEWVDDYLSLLMSADIVVLPDHAGTGLKNRAIQSMAAGKAVLGTKVAFEGLPVENGSGALVVGSTADARPKFNALVSQPDLRLCMGEAGRAQVLELFGPDVIGKRWANAYAERISGVRIDSLP
jgi:glycosyltransferase involved in cell wall biosynthesis